MRTNFNEMPSIILIIHAKNLQQQHGIVLSNQTTTPLEISCYPTTWYKK
jgi:hypothetical protein